MELSSVRKSAFFRADYWLSPSLEHCKIDHLTHARWFLENEVEDGNTKDSLLRNLNENDDYESVYELAFKMGWVRIVMRGDGSMAYDGRPTAKQLKEIKDWALENGSDLYNPQGSKIQEKPFRREGQEENVAGVIDTNGKFYESERKAQAHFDSIRLGDKDLKIVNLSTPKEQSKGFQFHTEIPKDYGLYFPNCGSHHFHMQNVGAPLLIVSLDDNHKVVGKEIRQPESLGKPIARGAGKHILEIHPLYNPWIEVGKKIGEYEKRESIIRPNYPVSRNKTGWLDKSANFYPVGQREEHEDLAERLLGLKEKVKEEDYGAAGDKLIIQGWARLVPFEDGVAVESNLLTTPQRKFLEDIALQFNCKVFHCKRTGTDTLFDFSKREAQTKGYLGIVDYQGAVHGVSDSGSNNHASEFPGKAWKRWRYKNGHIGWLDYATMNDVDEEHKSAVENWLHKKGAPVKKHDSVIEFYRDNHYRTRLSQRRDYGWLTPSAELLPVPDNHGKYLFGEYGKRKAGTRMWWLDPNGKMIPVSDHKKWARESGLLISKEDKLRPYESMEKKGYFRLAMEDSYNSIGKKLWVTCLTSSSLNSSQKSALEMYGIENEVTVELDVNSRFSNPPLRSILYEPPKREGQKRESQTGKSWIGAQRKDYGWLTPTGQYLPVLDNHGKSLREYNIGVSYDDAFSKGYVRVTFVGNALYANIEGSRGIYPKQKRELINIALETGKDQVVYDYGIDSKIIWQREGREARLITELNVVNPEAIDEFLKGSTTNPFIKKAEELNRQLSPFQVAQRRIRGERIALSSRVEAQATNQKLLAIANKIASELKAVFPHVDVNSKWLPKEVAVMAGDQRHEGFSTNIKTIPGGKGYTGVALRVYNPEAPYIKIDEINVDPSQQGKGKAVKMLEAIQKGGVPVYHSFDLSKGFWEHIKKKRPDLFNRPEELGKRESSFKVRKEFKSLLE